MKSGSETLPAEGFPLASSSAAGRLCFALAAAIVRSKRELSGRGSLGACWCPGASRRSLCCLFGRIGFGRSRRFRDAPLRTACRATARRMAARHVFDCPARDDRQRLLVHDLGVARLACGLVVSLDEEPVLPLFPRPATDTNEMPSAAQLLAFEREVEMALGVTLVGVGLRDPFPTIPDDDLAGAVIPRRDLALERAVFHRVVFDMHREALFAGHEARSARHGPALQNAIEFEPEVVMQPCRRVLLHHEGKLRRLRLPTLPSGLAGAAEIALCTVGVEVCHLIA